MKLFVTRFHTFASVSNPPMQAVNNSSMGAFPSAMELEVAFQVEASRPFKKHVSFLSFINACILLWEALTSTPNSRHIF